MAATNGIYQHRICSRKLKILKAMTGQRKYCNEGKVQSAADFNRTAQENSDLVLR